MKNVIYSVLTFIVLVSFISYLFDCVYDFKKAIVQPEFIIVYLITYLVANSWFILLGVIIYALIFKKIVWKYNVFLKILFVIAMAYIYAHNFYMNDWSPAMGQMKVIRLVVVFSITGILTIFINDRYFPKSNGNNNV